MSKRNILFLMTDEHRWDYMGYMDQPLLAGLTPTFDRLAREGIYFTNCYSPNPLCMPARHAIHSGLYTFQSGQMNNVGDWPMDVPTFTQALQSLGYHTALTGKLHAHEAVGYDIDLSEPQWDREIHALGFDDVVQVAGKTMDFFTDDHYTHYLKGHGLLYAYREDIVSRVEAGAGAAWPSVLPDEHYIDNYIGRKAVEWLDAYDDDRPFFHMVSFCSPHPSYDAYRSALDRVDRERVTLPVANEDPDRYRELIANYAAQIHIVDENVGRVIAALERRGWLDDTLIIYTADHGEMLGDSGAFAKCAWEDASVRVPALLRCPAWAALGDVSHAVVSCHDVAATILDYAADRDIVREALPQASSVSLKPLATRESAEVREAAYSENGGQFKAPWRMVDDGRFKYVRLLETGQELLFDKSTDPHCLRNVIDAAPPAVVAGLREHLLQVHLEHPSPKSGRAAYSPLVPHAITRARLESYARD